MSPETSALMPMGTSPSKSQSIKPEQTSLRYFKPSPRALQQTPKAGARHVQREMSWGVKCWGKTESKEISPVIKKVGSVAEKQKSSFGKLVLGQWRVKKSSEFCQGSDPNSCYKDVLILHSKHLYDKMSLLNASAKPTSIWNTNEIDSAHSPVVWNTSMPFWITTVFTNLYTQYLPLNQKLLSTQRRKKL